MKVESYVLIYFYFKNAERKFPIRHAKPKSVIHLDTVCYLETVNDVWYSDSEYHFLILQNAQTENKVL